MGIGMTKLKKTLLSKSLYRQCYIICLFACNISYLHFAAYVVLAFMVIWGAFLAVYHEITRRTSLKTRFGFWLIAFLVSSVVTMLIHLLDNLFSSDDGQETCLSILPIHHVFCISGDLLLTLRYGSTLCLCDDVTKFLYFIGIYFW